MIVVITTALLSVFGYYRYMSDRLELMQQLNEKIDRISSRLSTNLSLPMYNINIKGMINTIKAEMADQELLWIRLYENRDNKPLLAYKRLHDGTIIASEKEPIKGNYLLRQHGVF